MSSEINEHVVINTTESAVGAAFAGFGTQGILSCNASFPERSRAYSDLAEMSDDGFTSKTPEYRAAAKAFAQKPRPSTIKILRAIGAPTPAYRVDVLSVAAGYTYMVTLDSAAIAAATDVSYTPGADLVFTAEADDETMTSTGHGMETGEGPYRVSNSGGALPTGLAVDTNYWIIKVTADTFQLAATKADALASTEITITTDGTGTQTLRRAQNDVIIAQLVQGINAIASKDFTAAQVSGAGETDYMTITADGAGDWFSAEVNLLSLLKIEATHAEPGTTLATDLDNINEADPDWYGLTLLYPSDAVVKAAAAWVENNGKLLVQAMSDSTIATLGDTTSDTASDLKALNYARTAILYHPDPSAFAGAAWQGRVLSTEPGKATWKFKNLVGVVGATLTTTQRTNLRAKNANGYTVVGARATTWEGKTVDGDFIDVTRNIDWLDDRLQKRVYNALETNDIVPFTDPGIAIVENEIAATMDEAVERNILAGGDEYPVISVPKAAEVSEEDRGNRVCPDIAWSGRLAGAIHKAIVNGNVSV